jgi:hypothetical protein
MTYLPVTSYKQCHEPNVWEKMEKSVSQTKSAWCKHEVLSFQLGSVKRIHEPSKQGVLFLSFEVPRNAAGAK